MRYLEDNEVKDFLSEEELDDALKFYEETNKWFFPQACHIRVKGVDDLPLFYGPFMEKVQATCPEDVFEECVRGSGLFLEIPEFSTKNYYAVRPIALESVFERAGLACRLMRTFTDSGYVKAMSAERRGQILDMGFHQTHEPVKVLVSDEKIDVIGSQKYAILDYREGIEMGKNAILKQDDFDGLEFKEAFLSHEGLCVTYNLSGPGVDAHSMMLERHNMKAEGYLFTWASSHTKMSCMSGRLSVVVKGIRIPIGRAAKVRHLGDPKEQMKLFGLNVEALGKSLKENEDRIEALGNTEIQHPKACLQNVFDLCHSIPVAYKKRALDAMPADQVMSGMDIYLAACDAASNIPGVKDMVMAMEEVAHIQYLDLRDLDK